MTFQVTAKLHLAKKCLLSAAGLVAFAGPVAIGLALGPQKLAQAQASNSPTKHYQNLEQKEHYAHFVTGETTLGSKRVTTLDFDRQQADGGTRSVHQYFLLEGTLLYTLSFSTSDAPQTLIPTSDRIAASFTFDPTT